MDKIASKTEIFTGGVFILPKADGKIEPFIADKMCEDKEAVEAGLLMDLNDPRLQGFLKDRKGLKELAEKAKDNDISVDLPFGKKWTVCGSIIENGGIYLHLYHPVHLKDDGYEAIRQMINIRADNERNSVNLLGVIKADIKDPSKIICTIEAHLHGTFNPDSGEVYNIGERIYAGS